MSSPISPSERRVFSPEFKWNIVQQAKAKEQSISVIARQYNVNNNQVFRWCREVEAGKVLWVRRAKANMQKSNNELQEANTFLPVTVAHPVVTTTTSPVNCSVLTVEFRSGHRLVLQEVTPNLLQQLVVALA